MSERTYQAPTRRLLADLAAAADETRDASARLKAAQAREQRLINLLWRRGVARPDLYARSSYSPSQVWRYTP